MKNFFVFFGMLAALFCSCKQDESRKKAESNAEGSPSTLQFFDIKFILDENKTNLDINVEINSSITDDAYVLVSLFDGFVKTDSLTKIFKGYRKGYSISDFTLRSYARMPFGFPSAFIPTGLNHISSIPEDEAYSGLVVGYKCVVENSFPLDFPVFIKRIHLNEGMNIENVNIKFDQPLTYPIDGRLVVTINVLRINDRILKQIENYNYNNQSFKFDKILYDLYSKAFPDSSLCSFVFSNSHILYEISKMSEGELIDPQGFPHHEYCNYADNGMMGYEVFYQLDRQGDFSFFLWSLENQANQVSD